jgi:hypothetical protein
MMSRVHAKAGNVFWGKKGKATVRLRGGGLIYLLTYIPKSRRKRLSLVESCPEANPRRNRCVGLPALSCPWVRDGKVVLEDWESLSMAIFAASWIWRHRSQSALRPWTLLFVEGAVSQVRS